MFEDVEIYEQKKWWSETLEHDKDWSEEEEGGLGWDTVAAGVGWQKSQYLQEDEQIGWRKGTKRL